MSTANAVLDGSKMNDEQLGRFTRRMNDIQRRINQGTISYAWVMRELQLVAEGRNAESEDRDPFLPWKTVAVGTHASMAELIYVARRENEEAIDEGAIAILRAAAPSPTKLEIELVKVSGRDLGFSEVFTRAELYARAAEFGFETVSPEAALQLWRSYAKEQPLGECLVVAMTPIDGSILILCFWTTGLYPEGIRALSTHSAECGVKGTWTPDILWLFARRKR